MQIVKPPVEELENKLQVQLGQYEWFQIYRFFDFKSIIEGLDHVFFPKFSSILNPFSLIKPGDVTKIVIENFGVPPFQGTDWKYPYDNCRYWLEDTSGIQFNRDNWKGALVLPLSLTNAPHRQRYHRDLWKSFLSYTIDHFNRREDMIWVLSGLDSWHWEDTINPRHFILKQISPVLRRKHYNGNFFKLLQADI